jgi:hypothetical protein
MRSSYLFVVYGIKVVGVAWCISEGGKGSTVHHHPFLAFLGRVKETVSPSTSSLRSPCDSWGVKRVVWTVSIPYLVSLSRLILPACQGGNYSVSICTVSPLEKKYQTSSTNNPPRRQWRWKRSEASCGVTLKQNKVTSHGRIIITAG